MKSIPTSRIANAEVLYSAPARYQVKGQVINILLNLDAYVHSPEIQGVIDVPTSGYLNAALTWKPLKGDKLTLKAYCNDIFKTADNYLHDTFKGQHVINELHKGRTFGLSLTCRFGGYKTKKYGEVDTSRFGK